MLYLYVCTFINSGKGNATVHETNVSRTFSSCRIIQVRVRRSALKELMDGAAKVLNNKFIRFDPQSIPVRPITSEYIFNRQQNPASVPLHDSTATMSEQAFRVTVMTFHHQQNQASLFQPQQNQASRLCFISSRIKHLSTA